jgi:hypothetical protein
MPHRLHLWQRLQRLRDLQHDIMILLLRINAIPTRDHASFNDSQPTWHLQLLFDRLLNLGPCPIRDLGPFLVRVRSLSLLIWKLDPYVWGTWPDSPQNHMRASQVLVSGDL